MGSSAVQRQTLKFDRGFDGDCDQPCWGENGIRKVVMS
jgi:hypothetical protein